MDYSEILIRLNQKQNEYQKFVLKHDFKAAYETAKDIVVLAGLLQMTTREISKDIEEMSARMLFTNKEMK
jgi:hypothetical protein